MAWLSWCAEPGPQLHVLHPVTFLEGGCREVWGVPLVCWVSSLRKAKGGSSPWSLWIQFLSLNGGGIIGEV